MMARATPFEIHLTIDKLEAGRQDAFVECCLTNHAKPLLIELSRGQTTQQPMLSRIVHAGDMPEALAVANDLSRVLGAAGFPVTRLKMEVPATDAHRFQSHTTAFEPYFEWHGKVGYERVEELTALCEAHRAHLSANALKHDTASRFVTLRVFDYKEAFDARIAALAGALTNGGWAVSKQQAEYCIYDNNTLLDAGWLPQ